VGSGVTKFKKGDEVYARPDVTAHGNGAYAEYVVAKETETALRPKSIDHVHATTIPVGAVTAWRALFDAAGLKEGQRVLIHGAAGGVGSFAVQLGKWKGAYVIGTASSQNQAFLKELGVDEPVDYEKTRFEEVVRDVHVVFDPIGGETQKRSWQTLKKGGILVSIVAPPSKEEAKNMVCAPPSCPSREVQPCWPNSQHSWIRGKSNPWSRKCCRCPKPGRLTNSMRPVTLAAR